MGRGSSKAGRAGGGAAPELGDSILLNTGGGMVSRMTVINKTKSMYTLRPSNQVNNSAFTGGGDAANDMHVDAAYIKKNRLRNMGR